MLKPPLVPEEGFLRRPGQDIEYPPMETPFPRQSIGVRTMRHPDMFALPRPAAMVPGTRRMAHEQQSGITMKSEHLIYSADPLQSDSSSSDYDAQGKRKPKKEKKKMIELVEKESISLSDLPTRKRFLQWRAKMRSVVSNASTKNPGNPGLANQD